MDEVLKIIKSINRVIVNPAIVFMFFVAFLYFFWGIWRFFNGMDNETVRDEGRRTIMWGIIGMLIMVTAFTIINMILGTFGIDKTGPTYPDSTPVYPGILR